MQGTPDFANNISSLPQAAEATFGFTWISRRAFFSESIGFFPVLENEIYSFICLCHARLELCNVPNYEPKAIYCSVSSLLRPDGPSRGGNIIKSMLNTGVYL